jgi:hypothetical protein
LLERWRERPEAERLAKLSATETLIHKEGGALREFRDAVQRMAAEGRRRRLEVLAAKERESGLSAEERLELQQLLAGRSSSQSG